MAAAKTVFVTGANGYIGSAVARSFARAGWLTYGLTRRESALSVLVMNEIIPVFGSLSDISFISKIDACFDVIVSVTEDIRNYVPHYNLIMAMLRELVKKNRGKRPLILWTSGCKDYGMSPHLSNSKDLEQHTEETPLNPPPFAVDRANYSLKVFDMDIFDAAVLRPTNVYGFTSSFYAEFFAAGEQAAKKGVLEIHEDPMTILHAVHVDDCGDAYVALAEHWLEEPIEINGQCFNISSSKYETLEDIAEAIIKEYRVEDGVKWVKLEAADTPDQNVDRMLMGFSQWVGSGKIRALTGWSDKRLLFSQGLAVYRLSHEALGGGGKALNYSTVFN